MEARNLGCSAPMSWEALVAYRTGDLPPEEMETADLHLMDCAACTAQLARVCAVTEAIRVERGPAPKASPRKRWFAGAGGGALLVAAAAAFLLLPRAAVDATFRLPANVRDAVPVALSPEASVRDVRLQPELSTGDTPNAARVRRR